MNILGTQSSFITARVPQIIHCDVFEYRKFKIKNFNEILDPKTWDKFMKKTVFLPHQSGVRMEKKLIFYLHRVEKPKIIES